MEKTNIPKLARNKYNFIGKTTNSDYVTASQLQNKIPGNGGGGGGNSWTIQQQNKIAYAVQERAVPISGSYINGYMIESATYDSYIQEVYRTENLYNDDVKTINGYSIVGTGDIEVEGTYVDLSSYVTKVELSQELASYVTNTYLTTHYSTSKDIDDILSSYVTKSELDLASYATELYVGNQCKIVKDNCYAYTTLTSQDVQKACYAYTDAKTSGNTITYSYVVDIVRDYIAKLIADGDLVNGSYVINAINSSRP